MLKPPDISAPERLLFCLFFFFCFAHRGDTHASSCGERVDARPQRVSPGGYCFVSWGRERERAADLAAPGVGADSSPALLRPPRKYRKPPKNAHGDFRDASPP